MIKFEANYSGERQLILKSHYQVVKYRPKASYLSTSPLIGKQIVNKFIYIGNSR